MKLQKSLHYIIPLSLVLLGLIGYSFLSAQEFNQPSGTAPGGNVPAPVNVGSIYQAKTGDLGAIRMRAGLYCNADGTVCFDPTNVGTATTTATTSDDVIVGGRCFKPANLVTCNWNWSGKGNDDATYVIPISQDPTSCGSSGRTYVRHDVILAECESTYYRWQVGEMSCSAPYAQQCERTYGTNSRTVTCVNGPGATVPEINCINSAGPKPSTSGGACSRYGGGSSSC